MKYLITIFGIFGTILLAAHPGNLRSVEPSIWELTDGTAITGYLLYVRPSEVVIQQEDETVVPIDIRRFNTADQVHFHKKAIDIDQLQTHSLSAAPRKAPIGLSVGILLLVLFAIYHLWKQRHRSWATLSIAGGLQLAVFVWLGFVQAVQPVSTTDPLVVDAAFAPFKPNVRTSWDAQYFYVASLGIPQHQMMVGITSWQQQVPLPQCYVGTNAWSIPLNPALAAQPLSIEEHFMKGAVAIAVNGIPIFNARNNTGKDSYLAGELDQYGGHCGRADDYHYHIAPLHLEGRSPQVLPIGYALDGYALYGSLEPDGSPMQVLDANHGHFGQNGVYHYHGTKTYPYSVGKMVGKVILDPKTPAPEDQILPQAFAKPVRPAQTPLTGATITGFNNPAAQKYSLQYRLNQQTYTIDYSWTNSGQYTFEFISPSGIKTTQRYTSDSICQLPAVPISDPFSLSSSAVGADSLLPQKYTCWGTGINPPLEWKNPPSGTTCYTAVMHHLDKDLAEKTYMILYNLPASTTSIRENESGNGLWGGNTQNNLLAYSPPCSQGPGKKAYFITVYALKQYPAFTTPPKTRQELLQAIQGLSLDSASIQVYYDNTASGNINPDSLLNGPGLLGRPTDSSVTLSVLPAVDVDLYIEYGLQSGQYTGRTETFREIKNVPIDIQLSHLSPDTRYHYRIQVRPAGTTLFYSRPEYTFHTQRRKGSTFTFVVQADPHLDEQSDTQVYKICLQNQLADQPDFMVDLGDFLMSDKLQEPSYQKIEDRSLLLRRFYEVSGHTVPLFIALGNHEGEAGWTLDGTANNVAIWNTLARKKYFPNPFPNHFFSGDTTNYPFVGQRESYFSWEWGDALFIVLDPYWYTNIKPTKDRWNWTLGKKQYDWLRRTLETSTATFKFVFAHTLIGGSESARGGVEFANLYEWGGANEDGSFGFSINRPGWYKPIHELLKENNATLFFHGHDHFYANQQLDCIGYQLVPQPSHPQFLTAIQAQDYGYLQGTIIPNAGHLRVTVSSDAVKVDYIRAFKPENETTTRKNREIADSYTIRKGDCFTTGLIPGEENASNQFIQHIYPNPMADKCFLEVNPHILPEQLEFLLKNQLGQIVSAQAIWGTQTIEYDLKNNPPGLYTLVVRHKKNGQIESHILVKK
ncbi:MAG: YHYH protein [Haliscomenobacter sp.]